MKQNMKFQVSLFVAVAITVAATSVFARRIDPVVSTDWLEDNQSDVTVLDIRSADAYAEGHIPGAINEPWIVPFSAWITMSPEYLLLEMPAAEDLMAALGAMGIDKHSKVVVVGAPTLMQVSPFTTVLLVRYALR